MYIAVDDTDSRKGMCTTYVLSEIILRSGLDLIGYPSLVRLNPAIEHKTRGNGALIANLGKGKGEPRKIGSSHGSWIFSYPGEETSANGRELMDLASEIIGEIAELQEEETNPGIVASEKKFDPSFYWKAVREEVTIAEAERFINQQGGSFRKVKNGRGIIGSAAAISWPGSNVTYEVLNYRFPSGESIGSERKMGAAVMADGIEGSFNNIDHSNNYAAIFPKERTPVVFGVRGTDPDALLNGCNRIIEEYSIGVDRSILFSTNQATDDHIIKDPVNLLPGHSYSIEGTIAGNVCAIKGGHYFTYLQYGNSGIKLAAFEPTKEFRKVFSSLAIGDRVCVYGTYKDNCLNVEKMRVITVSSLYSKAPPVCPKCDGVTHSKGHNDYRCNQCGYRSSMAVYRLKERGISPGLYDVPVIARRHLSRPFAMRNHETKELEREVSA